MFQVVFHVDLPFVYNFVLFGVTRNIYVIYEIMNDKMFLLTCCKMFVVMFGMVVALLLYRVLVLSHFHPIGVYKGNKDQFLMGAA